VVCQTEPRECIILPCRHCCLCYECAKDLTQTGSVQVEYGQVRRRSFRGKADRYIVAHFLACLELIDDCCFVRHQVQTGADPKCPMCREDIESVIRKGDKKASAKASKKKSKHKSKSAKGGGGGGGGGDGKVAAPPVGGGGGGGGGGELPYGGDMQAAMKAGDRDAIRQLMQARDGAAASGGGGGGEGPEPEPERAATPPPVDGGGGDLPYGGDMQKAMQAQDRDAIRAIMAARDKGRQ